MSYELTHEQVMALTIVAMPSGDLFYSFNADGGGINLLCRACHVHKGFLNLFASSQIMYKHVVRAQGIFSALAMEADKLGNMAASNAYLDEAANANVTLQVAREGMNEILRKTIGNKPN